MQPGEREERITGMGIAISMELLRCDHDLGCLTAHEIADTVVVAIKDMSNREDRSEASRETCLKGRLHQLRRRIDQELLPFQNDP